MYEPVIKIKYVFIYHCLNRDTIQTDILFVTSLEEFPECPIT